jgi:hypothetical protein
MVARPGESNFSDLKAVSLNCSIKKDGTKSHTQRLLNRVAGVMEKEAVQVEQIYALDHDIAFGKQALQIIMMNMATFDWTQTSLLSSWLMRFLL